MSGDSQGTLREWLLTTEIFEPGNGGLGQGLDNLVAQRPELLRWKDDEILQELRAMETGGLVITSHGYWHSTLDGQVARERQFQEAGLRAPCLRRQTEFEIDDLVLAIAATKDVSSNFHHHANDQDLKVYLHARQEECGGGVDRLVAAGLLRKPMMFDPRRRELVLSARGTRHYHEVVSARLGLGEGSAILDAPPEAEGESEVAAGIKRLTLKPEMEVNLISRWREGERCEGAGAFLAATIMYGSVMEGVLVSLVERDFAKANTARCAPKGPGGKVKGLREWKLQELIDVGREVGWVPAAVHKHCHELRDSRNLVHPWKAVSDGVDPDRHLAEISRIVVTAVVRTVSPSQE